MADNPMLDPSISYSTNRFTSNGSQTTFELSFAGGYISQSNVKAYYVDDNDNVVFKTLTFVGANTVSIATPVPAGKVLTVYRDTPKDAPLVDFADGAVINEKALDKLARQAILATGEMIDRFTETITGVRSDASNSVVVATAAQTTANNTAALLAAVTGVDYSNFVLTTGVQTLTGRKIFSDLAVGTTASTQTNLKPNGQFSVGPGATKTINAWGDLTGVPSEVTGLATSLSGIAGSLATTQEDVATRVTYADYSRVILAVAELRANQIGTPNGFSDAFGDADGISGVSTGHAYEAVGQFTNVTPAGSSFIKNNAGSTALGATAVNGLATNGSVLVVAQGTNIKKATSGLDPSAWTTTVTGSQYRDVIWVSRIGLFIAVGAGGVSVSSNGTSWNLYSTAATAEIRAVTDTGSALIAVTNNAEVLRSGNGTDWQLVTTIGANLSCVTAGANGVVLVGSSATASVYRSTDHGVSWSTVALPSSGTSGSNARAIGWNGSYFLILDGPSAKWRKSVDGLTWTSGTTTGLGTGVNNYALWNGQFWIVDVGGTIYKSVDGVTWTSVLASIGMGGAAILPDGSIVSGGANGNIHQSQPVTSAMDLRSVPVSAAVVPSKASLVVIAKGASTITVGTHLTGYVSRNGVSGTFQTVSLVAAQVLDNGYTVFEVYGADVSGLPSGSSMVARIVTTGSFRVDVTSWFLAWS